MRVRENIDLKGHNNLHLESSARFYCEVTSDTDAQEAIAFAQDRGLPSLVIGEGTNLVLLDDLDLVVICPRLSGIEMRGTSVEAAAGENWHSFVKKTLDSGYSGLENLALIPGSVGAAPVQNIGAYGSDISQHLESLTAIQLSTGDIHHLTRAQCDFGYRESLFKKESDWLITRVTFNLLRDEAPDISYPDLQRYFQERQIAVEPRSVFDAVVSIRTDKLPDPAETPNVGSFFKNPQVSVDKAIELERKFEGMPVFESGPDERKLSAAWLIDQAGLKAVTEGGFQVSPQHALVIVRVGEGTTQDLIQLITRIKSTVSERYGVDLEIEPTLYP